MRCTTRCIPPAGSVSSIVSQCCDEAKKPGLVGGELLPCQLDSYVTLALTRDRRRVVIGEADVYYVQGDRPPADVEAATRDMIKQALGFST